MPTKVPAYLQFYPQAEIQKAVSWVINIGLGKHNCPKLLAGLSENFIHVSARAVFE